MRGTCLRARVERRAIEGLLDGAEDALQRTPAFLTEERPGLPTSTKLVSQGGHHGSGLVQCERCAWRDGPRRRPPETLLVVLEQEPPGPRVLLDHLEHGPALVCDQRMSRERPCQQPDGLLDLAQPPLGQPPRVQRVAMQEVIAKGTGGPNPELSAAERLDAVADRDDDVQVVVVDAARDPAPAFRSNLCKFCTGCPRVQLALFEGVPDVLRHDRALPPEQLRHLLLGQPDSLPLQAHVHPHLTIRRLVDDDLATRRLAHHTAL